MKLYFKCDRCSKEYCIAAIDPDKHLILCASVPCTEGCGGKLKKVRKQDTKDPVYSAAKELFQRAMGQGTEGERYCRAQRLLGLMTGDTIVDVELADIPGTNRSIVESITLKSGWVLHFATSTHGATIYKVTKKEGAQ